MTDIKDCDMLTKINSQLDYKLQYDGVYTNGCRDDLEAQFDFFVIALSIAGMVVAFVFLIVALFAMCVCCSKKK